MSNHEKAFKELLSTQIRFGCLEHDRDGAYYPIYRGSKRFGKSRVKESRKIEQVESTGEEK